MNYDDETIEELLDQEIQYLQNEYHEIIRLAEESADRS